MLAFEGLHAGQLIGAEGPFALLGQGWGLRIQPIDVGELLIELLIRLRREPVANQMRSETACFLKAGPHGGVKSSGGCPA